jgi:purine catabolism regulator
VPPLPPSRDSADDVAAAAALARVATASDRPQELLDWAAPQLRRPLGLAGPHGEPLASSAADGLSADALAIACAAADGSTTEAPGWSVVPVERLGHLAAGPPTPAASRSPAFLDLLRSLLATQLQRGRLRDEGRAKQRAALVRRLVRDPGPDPARASRHAAGIGVELADSYRAAVLVWADRVDDETLASVQIEAARRDCGCLTLPLEGRLLLLHPRRDEPDADCLASLHGLVAFARRAGTGAVQALAGRAAPTLAELPAEVEELLGLSRVMDVVSEPDVGVVHAERFGLERLLHHGLETRAAAAFVEAELGALIAWDARHDDDLLAVVEAALDCPHYGDAARCCYMHRNTFRQHLRRACELLGQPLDDPRRRLALHVALKLRRLLGPAGAHADHRSKSTSDRVPRGGRGAGPTLAIVREGAIVARGATTVDTGSA